MYRDVPVKFLPVVWFEQTFKLSDSFARIIKISSWVPIVVQIIGFIVALVGIYNVFLLTTRKRQDLTIERDSNYNTIELDPTKLKRLPFEQQTLIN